jgi:hypothetical protein
MPDLACSQIALREDESVLTKSASIRPGNRTARSTLQRERRTRLRGDDYGRPALQGATVVHPAVARGIASYSPSAGARGVIAHFGTLPRAEMMTFCNSPGFASMAAHGGWRPTAIVIMLHFIRRRRATGHDVQVLD